MSSMDQNFCPDDVVDPWMVQPRVRHRWILRRIYEHGRDQIFPELRVLDRIPNRLPSNPVATDTAPAMTSNLLGLFRRRPEPAVVDRYTFPYELDDNPYRAKRPWPPEFAQLSQKHQFRLERRYRRRTKLKWARPNWNKGVQLVQWGTILSVAVYAVLILDTDPDKKGSRLFDGIRKAVWVQDSGSNGGAREKSLDGSQEKR